MLLLEKRTEADTISIVGQLELAFNLILKENLYRGSLLNQKDNCLKEFVASFSVDDMRLVTLLTLQ